MNQKLLEIILKLRDQLTPGLQASATKSKAALSKITTATNNMRTGFSKAVFSVKGLVAALAGMVILRQVARWMSETVTIAADQEFVLAKLNQVVPENTENLIDQATALQNLTGVADDVIINSQAMLATFALNADEIAVLTPRLLDMATALRKTTKEQVDVQSVAIAMGKAVTIGSGALSRYGVALTDAQAAQLDLATGMERIVLIGEILDDNFQGLAVAAGKTFAGRVDILTAAWDDLREGVGNWIIQSPKVNGIIEVLTDAIIGQTDAIDASRQSGDDLVGVTFAKIIQGGLFVAKAIFGVRDAFFALAAAIDFVALKAIKLLRFLNTDFIRDLTMFGLPVSGGLGLFNEQAVDSELAILEEAFATRLGEIELDLQAFAENQEFLSALSTAVGESVAVVGNNIENARTPIQGATDDLNDMADATNAAADAFKNLIPQPVSILQTLADALEDVRRAAAETLPSLSEFDINVLNRLSGLGANIGIGRDAPFVGSREGATIARLGARLGREVPFGGVPNGGGGPGLEQILGFAQTGIGGFQRGGAQGAISSLLPGIGTLIGGPVGGLIGGILGGFLGKKKKPRGDSRANPVFTHDVKADLLLTELVNASKSNLIRLGAVGGSDVWASIKAQAQRVGAS